MDTNFVLTSQHPNNGFDRMIQAASYVRRCLFFYTNFRSPLNAFHQISDGSEDLQEEILNQVLCRG
jgi:hypothetical protein